MIVLDTNIVSKMLRGYSAHEKPPFRRMGSHYSGPWEASGGCPVERGAGSLDRWRGFVSFG
ncbi:MAG: hypothetical protein U1A22_02480, partial [Xanthomonadaceae bacterium]|nr:hypothetical protein [Xanthomonadaceae bacterium]